MNSFEYKTNLISLHPNLLNFAYKLTSNRDDAHDLLQETTLKVLDNEDKFSENTNFKSWVFTIMRNIFINNYRRTVRASIVVDTSEHQHLLNSSRSLLSTTPENSFGVYEIANAIKALANEYRIPFTLLVAGYKYNEIATKLNLNIGTIKSRIFNARKKLQQHFTDYR